MKVVFSTFKREDFPEYKSWYDDAELNMRLGPMDDDWLEHVMNEKSSHQHSVFLGEELIAVIGMLLPDTEHPSYYITDFAVKPNLRTKGLGSTMLKELLRQYPLNPGQSWKAFVDANNRKAKLFFEKNGWISSDKPDADNMFTLEIITPK